MVRRQNKQPITGEAVTGRLVRNKRNYFILNIVTFDKNIFIVKYFSLTKQLFNLNTTIKIAMGLKKLK
jgi:hypothetical protein